MERRRAVPHKKRKRSPARRRLHCQPFKFCKSVLEALGETSFAAGTDIIAQLAQKTGKPAPAPLAGLAGKAVRFTDVTGKDEMTQVVTEFLR